MTNPGLLKAPSGPFVKATRPAAGHRVLSSGLGCNHTLWPELRACDGWTGFCPLLLSRARPMAWGDCVGGTEDHKKPKAQAHDAPIRILPGLTGPLRPRPVKPNKGYTRKASAILSLESPAL